MNQTLRKTLTVAAFGLCIAAGCDRNAEVRQYQQPKETPPASSATSKPVAAPGMVMPTAPAAGLDWNAPEGWREDTTPHPMRAATYAVGDGDKAAEFVVTRLGGGFGDYTSNINRWRQQVGLDTVTDGSTVPTQTVKTPVGDATVVDLDGPDKKMTVAMVKQGDATWFFKLTGPKATVTDNRAKFEQLLGSLKVQ